MVHFEHAVKVDLIAYSANYIISLACGVRKRSLTEVKQDSNPKRRDTASSLPLSLDLNRNHLNDVDLLIQILSPII